MTGSFETNPQSTPQPTEHDASGTEQVNLRAIDPVLIGQLEERFQTVPASRWQPNTYDWHATHEEQFKTLAFTSSDPRLPEMSVQAVRKRLNIGSSRDLGSEYRFTFEKPKGDIRYQIADLRINGNGTYNSMYFSALYKVKRIGAYDSSGVVSRDYRQAMERIGLLPFLAERLPEDIYLQPGVYGLKILDTILRGYLNENQ